MSKQKSHTPNSPSADALDGKIGHAMRAYREGVNLPHGFTAGLEAIYAQPQIRLRRPPSVRVGWGLATATACAFLVLVPIQHSLNTPSVVDDLLQRRLEELHVQVPEDGHTWIDLHLSAHELADEHASIHLSAPDSLMIDANNADAHGESVSTCDTSGQCWHTWDQSSSSGAAPLRVGVREPGRYIIDVAHHSNSNAKHDRWIVNARRK